MRERERKGEREGEDAEGGRWHTCPAHDPCLMCPQLCEVLCLCVDFLMDGTGREGGQLLRVTESEREEVLVHFSGPLQFLNHLDIAHIFEYFYR